jgi:hypothetical protein
MGCAVAQPRETLGAGLGSDCGPHPRSRRARDCLGLELEKLGQLAPDVPEDGNQGRTAQHHQRNHGGRSDAEPEPHRRGDLNGIYGCN